MAEKGFMNLPLALGMGILGGLRPSRAPQSFFSALGPGLAQGLQMYAASQPKPQSELEKLRLQQIQAQMATSKQAAAQAAQRRAMQEQWIETQPPEAQKLYRAFPDLAAKEFFKNREPAKPGSLKPVFNTATNTHQFATPAQITSNPNLVPPAAAPKSTTGKNEDPYSLKGNRVFAQLANTQAAIETTLAKGMKPPRSLITRFQALIDEFQRGGKFRQEVETADGTIEVREFDTPGRTLSPETAQLANQLGLRVGNTDASAATQRDTQDLPEAATQADSQGGTTIAPGKLKKETQKERANRAKFENALTIIGEARELLGPKTNALTGWPGSVASKVGSFARTLQQLPRIGDAISAAAGPEGITMGLSTDALRKKINALKGLFAKPFLQDANISKPERELIESIVGNVDDMDPDQLLQSLSQLETIVKRLLGKKTSSGGPLTDEEKRDLRRLEKLYGNR